MPSGRLWGQEVDFRPCEETWSSLLHCCTWRSPTRWAWRTSKPCAVQWSKTWRWRQSQRQILEVAAAINQRRQHLHQPRCLHSQPQHQQQTRSTWVSFDIYLHNKINDIKPCWTRSCNKWWPCRAIIHSSSAWWTPAWGWWKMAGPSKRSTRSTQTFGQSATESATKLSTGSYPRTTPSTWSKEQRCAWKQSMEDPSGSQTWTFTADCTSLATTWTWPPADFKICQGDLWGYGVGMGRQDQRLPEWDLDDSHRFVSSPRSATNSPGNLYSISTGDQRSPTTRPLDWWTFVTGDWMGFSPSPWQKSSIQDGEAWQATFSCHCISMWTLVPTHAAQSLRQLGGHQIWASAADPIRLGLSAISATPWPPFHLGKPNWVSLMESPWSDQVPWRGGGQDSPLWSMQIWTYVCTGQAAQKGHSNGHKQLSRASTIGLSALRRQSWTSTCHWRQAHHFSCRSLSPQCAKAMVDAMEEELMK